MKKKINSTKAFDTSNRNENKEKYKFVSNGYYALSYKKLWSEIKCGDICSYCYTHVVNW